MNAPATQDTFTKMDLQDTAVIDSYHAHVYFDTESKERAWALREQIEHLFDMEMGRFHEKPVGPHPCWSYQVAFRAEVFGEIVPWLALNRDDLVVFLHPNTGRDLEDHRDHAIWFGEKMALKLEIFEDKP
jgi:aromatic ring-cleaving dioxygenase